MKRFFKKLLLALLHIFWIFPINKRAIVVQSFDGRAYSDSCKYVIEYFRNNSIDDYTFYWVSKTNTCDDLPDDKRIKIVKKHSLKFCFVCLTSKIIVVNILPERYLPLRKSQKVIDIWHGMPYKKLSDTSTFSKGNSFDVCSVCLSHNEFYTNEVLHNTFSYYGEILNCGIPRNDILFDNSRSDIIKKVREFCGLDSDTKILLFAPTFRGKFVDTDTNLDYNSLHNSLVEKFGGKWAVLFRAHPMLKLNTDKIEKVINVSSYADMAELLYASDILITDYSSSMWDFSLTEKPVFLFAPDIDDYAGDRGFYVDMRTLPFPLAVSNEELCTAVSVFDNAKYQKNLRDYQKQIGNYEKGQASKAVADKILELTGSEGK